MQKHNSSFNFFVNSIRNANREQLDWMKSFARCLSRYCYSTCSFSHDMLYKSSKFRVFSDFNSISMSYFSQCEDNSLMFCFSKTSIKSWYSSDTVMTYAWHYESFIIWCVHVYIVFSLHSESMINQLHHTIQDLTHIYISQ